MHRRNIFYYREPAFRNNVFLYLNFGSSVTVGCVNQENDLVLEDNSVTNSDTEKEDNFMELASNSNYLSKCPECLQDVEGLLRNHLQIPKLDFRCTICGLLLSSFCSLKAHRRLHNYQLPIVCPQCGNEFQKGEKFKKHMKKCLLAFHCSVYQCCACVKSLESKEVLYDHLLDHIRTVNYCRLCYSHLEAGKEKAFAHVWENHWECIYETDAFLSQHNFCSICRTIVRSKEDHAVCHTKEVSETSYWICVCTKIWNTLDAFLKHTDVCSAISTIEELINGKVVGSEVSMLSPKDTDNEVQLLKETEITDIVACICERCGICFFNNLSHGLCLSCLSISYDQIPNEVKEDKKSVIVKLTYQKLPEDHTLYCKKEEVNEIVAKELTFQICRFRRSFFDVEGGRSLLVISPLHYMYNSKPHHQNNNCTNCSSVYPHYSDLLLHSHARDEFSYYARLYKSSEVSLSHLSKSQNCLGNGEVILIEKKIENQTNRLSDDIVLADNCTRKKRKYTKRKPKDSTIVDSSKKLRKDNKSTVHKKSINGNISESVKQAKKVKKEVKAKRNQVTKKEKNVEKSFNNVEILSGKRIIKKNSKFDDCIFDLKGIKSKSKKMKVLKGENIVVLKTDAKLLPKCYFFDNNKKEKSPMAEIIFNDKKIYVDVVK